VGAPIRRTTVTPPFRRISLPHCTIKSTLFATNVRCGHQLADLYEPDEARLWLFARQKLLNGEIPADLIRQGRTDEVLKIIRQILDGVYV